MDKDKLKKALLKALQKDPKSTEYFDAYVWVHPDGDTVVIDGSYNLSELAQRIIEALNES